MTNILTRIPKFFLVHIEGFMLGDVRVGVRVRCERAWENGSKGVSRVGEVGVCVRDKSTKERGRAYGPGRTAGPEFFRHGRVRASYGHVYVSVGTHKNIYVKERVK